MDLVEQLRLTLSAASKQRLTRRDTDDSEAHQLYLKGRSAWQKAVRYRPLDPATLQSAKQAVAYFEAAIERDPEFALPYAGLADVYLVNTAAGLPRMEAERRARAALTKALALDPQLAEVQTALGSLLWADWDFAGVEKAYARAIELNPNYAEAHHWYAHLLVELGRIDEAQREMEAWLALDPVSGMSVGHMVAQLVWARRYDDAIAWNDKYRQIEPDGVALNLCDAYYAKGWFEEVANCIIKREKHVLTSTQVGDLKSAFARDGIDGLFRVRIDQLKAVTDEAHANIVVIAALYARLGETEETFRYLEQAYAMRARSLPAIGVSLRYDNVRGDPRFADIMRRIGLPPLAAYPSAAAP